MNVRHALATAGAFCHLALVACGASRCGPFPGGSRANSVVRSYGDLSGSSSGYGFFAPGVAREQHTTFIVTGPSGRTRTVLPEPTANPSVRIRRLRIERGIGTR
jgi:hypothetical protein